jgi:DNA-binding GntR family transcriptional regulator
MSVLEVLQSTSLPEAIQDEIARLILIGEFKAGQKLTEMELSSRLRVSRGPIREALRGLEEAGLITMERNRGAFVREISVDEAADLYEVRMGLGDIAVRILAAKITEAQIAELRELLRQMDAALKSDIKNYYPLNVKFHDRIIEMTGNRRLLEIHRQVMNEMHLMRQRSIFKGGGIKVSIQEHRVLLKALATRNGDKAAQAVRAHVLAGRTRLLKTLEASEK